MPMWKIENNNNPKPKRGGFGDFLRGTPSTTSVEPNTYIDQSRGSKKGHNIQQNRPDQLASHGFTIVDGEYRITSDNLQNSKVGFWAWLTGNNHPKSANRFGIGKL